MEPLAPPLDRPLSFNDTFVDFIPLVDPSPLPTTNFFPTTNALALYDRLGNKCSVPSSGNAMLFDIDEGDEEEAADDEDGPGGESDGAAEAILQEGVTMQRQTSKRPAVPVIDIGSDSSDDDMKIVYSVPGSSVTWTGGTFRPRVHSVWNVVVKERNSPHRRTWLSYTLWRIH